MSGSHICRDPAARRLDSLIFLIICWSGHFINPKNVGIFDVLEVRLKNYLCGAFKNSWDESYLFYLQVEQCFNHLNVT